MKRPHKKSAEKIALVLTGGGMRCAYSAGALVALVEKFGLTDPYALAAESGSVGNAMYYLARQYDAARVVWTEQIANNKKVVSRTAQLNIDYLVDDIFKKQTPLKTKNIDRTKVKYFFSVTNATTGATEFITNKSPFNYFEVMRAAKAVPILYRKRVRLGLKKYIDGGVSANIADLARQVLQTGATTVVTINCEPQIRALSMKLALGLDARLHGRRLKDAMLHDLSLPPGVCPTSDTAKVICITPSEPLQMKIFSNSKKDLTYAFELGYKDISSNTELRRLLGAPKKA